jgi:hypothetical protein
MSALYDIALKTSRLSSVFSLRSFFELLDLTSMLDESLSVLFLMLNSGVSINLLSLSGETFVLHDIVSNVPLNSLIHLLNLFEFISLVFLFLFSLL